MFAVVAPGDQDGLPRLTPLDVDTCCGASNGRGVVSKQFILVN